MTRARRYPASDSWVLLGELDKFVPLSAARFADVAINATSCVCALVGAEGERVNVTAIDASGAARSQVATIDASGAATLVFQ